MYTCSVLVPQYLEQAYHAKIGELLVMTCSDNV